MFTDFVESATNWKAGRRRWTIATSMVFQTVGVLVMVSMPLLYTQALPKLILNAFLAAPIFLEPPPATPPSRAAAPAIQREDRLIRNGILVQPLRIPSRVVIFEEAALPPEPPADMGGVGDRGADLFNLLTQSRVDVPRPPVPVAIQRIRQTQIEPAMILAQPQPVYPRWARDARIQGIVVLHAIIDREGRVAELQVISGHPVLAQAALAAVRDWRYRPTLLSGDPVEVDTTITVRFVLGG